MYVFSTVLRGPYEFWGHGWDPFPEKFFSRKNLLCNERILLLVFDDEEILGAGAPWDDPPIFHFFAPGASATSTPTTPTTPSVTREDYFDLAYSLFRSFVDLLLHAVNEC